MTKRSIYLIDVVCPLVVLLILWWNCWGMWLFLAFATFASVAVSAFFLNSDLKQFHQLAVWEAELDNYRKGTGL